MPIDISVPDLAELKPRITVFGVGGGGCNAVNNMINSNLSGVEFVVANTDAQALANSPCERKIQLGVNTTQGLGAGSQPEIGTLAAEETKDEIVNHLVGSHMVFITAGMGGGTGTGAAPVIASLAREQGILTVGVVTKPFNFEGRRRMAIAERGIDNLAQHVDTLIVIPNQNLFRVANEATSFTAAFQMADQVLFSGVASITELITREGLINLDFADVRAVMSDMGKAMMGTGEASGENRAEEAALAAISNPLLDIDSMAGARGVLISIAGGPDLTLYEVDQAASRIREEVDPEANIIVGATIEEDLEGTMRVSVVATGLQQEAHQEQPAASQPASAVRMAHPMPSGGMPTGIYSTASVPHQKEPREAESGRNGGDASHAEPPASAPEMRVAPVADTMEDMELPLEPQPQPQPAESGKAQDEAAAHPSAAPRPHRPAPEAPPVDELGGGKVHVPGVEEMPSPIREMAEEKQRRIWELAGMRPTDAAPASAPGSSGQQTADADSNRRKYLFERVKDLFGRGQTAPHKEEAAAQQPQRQQPRMRVVNGGAEAAGGQAAAGGAHMDASPLEDDDLGIPAFLRRK